MELTSVQQTAGHSASAAVSRPRSGALVGRSVAVSGAWQAATQAFAVPGAISSIDLATKPATHMYVDPNHRVRRLREPSP
jgi:hypothetical protein